MAAQADLSSLGPHAILLLLSWGCSFADTDINTRVSAVGLSVFSYCQTKRNNFVTWNNVPLERWRHRPACSSGLSDQSLCCLPEEILISWLYKKCKAKNSDQTAAGLAGWSETSLVLGNTSKECILVAWMLYVFIRQCSNTFCLHFLVYEPNILFLNPCHAE